MYYMTWNGMKDKYDFTDDKIRALIAEGIVIPHRFNDKWKLKLYGHAFYWTHDPPIDQ